MPRQPRTPSLRRHAGKSRAVVTLNGKDHYLGPWPAGQSRPSPEVSAAYHRLIAEWEARGRRPEGDPVRTGLPTPTGAPADLTVNELILAFWKHAEVHYRRADGTHTKELEDYRYSLRPLRELYGSLPAAEFGPLKLKAVRSHMVKGGLSRKVTNQRVGRIVRMFKWGVGEELVKGTVYQDLKAVQGLQQGRCDARETAPVEPVAVEVVEKTLPFLLRPVAAMVRLQLLTGARPGEVTLLRPVDIDRSGPVWVYRPAAHKTAHHGKNRVVTMGPKAQEVLLPCLEERVEDAYLFSPAEAMKAFRAGQRAARKSKVQPSQQDRSKRHPRKRFRTHYRVQAYAQAVANACEKAGVPHWHPHQLRHTHATEVRRRFGLEAAQVALGHSQAKVTEVYAERDLTLAAKVAAEIG